MSSSSAIPPPYYPPSTNSPAASDGYKPAPAYFNNPAAGPAAPQYQPQPMQPTHQQQSSNVVVVSQPAPIGFVTPHPVGDHYLTLSIVMTVLCVLTFHWHALLCTIPAIVFSSMARDADQRGDYAAAKSHAKVSLILNILSFVFWIVVIIIAGVLIAVAMVRIAAAKNYIDSFYDGTCDGYYYYNYVYDSTDC